MKHFFLFPVIFSKLDTHTISELRNEDIRMATHLQSHGFRVSNSKYPLLTPSKFKAKTPTHSNSYLTQEDERMIKHLRGEGWTIFK
ncbi:hypothetical protein NBO_376g0009 [Nosema bombycis CQ1]|uniref:Uncharacterized protein n=1 Tax=Nosema bombycis (strain CQ1 / CVCC 102059) TaxID=578461 RepID=R0KPT4_NOSB1|nr:hypothetical protein NBO_376g0009 [Nosema bombycis CQ1]|eukprot:EOB12721.1 hypothetical protein NBO_376g0009 [Nosema bombycis CQ1]